MNVLHPYKLTSMYLAQNPPPRLSSAWCSRPDAASRIWGRRAATALTWRSLARLSNDKMGDMLIADPPWSIFPVYLLRQSAAALKSHKHPPVRSGIQWPSGSSECSSSTPMSQRAIWPNPTACSSTALPPKKELRALTADGAKCAQGRHRALPQSTLNSLLGQCS